MPTRRGQTQTPYLLATLATALAVSCGPFNAKCFTSTGLVIIDKPLAVECAAIEPLETKVIELYARFGFRASMMHRWSLHVEGRRYFTMCIGQEMHVAGLEGYAHEAMHAMHCELGIHEYGDDKWSGHKDWDEKVEGLSRWEAIDRVNGS